MTSRTQSPHTMQAWISNGYGGPEVLTLEERPLPVPRAGEVRINICAATVSSADVRMRASNFPRGFAVLGRLALGIMRLRQPILGTDFAGTVDAIGSGVTAFKVGDAVMGFTGAKMRCHARYRVMPAEQSALAFKPAKLSFEEAASLPFGATTALHFLRKAQLKPGESILVIGASGAVGSAFVQLAGHMGAVVTGVTSGPNVSLVRSLGADAVIDYTQQNFTQAAATYDIIADTVGASSFAQCHTRLNEHGRYLSVAGDLMALFARARGTKRSIGGPAPDSAADLHEVVKLAESGALKPVIDRTYPFARLPEAHAYVETGRKRGSVVVSVGSS